MGIYFVDNIPIYSMVLLYLPIKLGDFGRQMLVFIFQHHVELIWEYW